MARSIHKIENFTSRAAIPPVPPPPLPALYLCNVSNFAFRTLSALGVFHAFDHHVLHAYRISANFIVSVQLLVHAASVTYTARSDPTKFLQTVAFTSRKSPRYVRPTMILRGFGLFAAAAARVFAYDIDVWMTVA